MEEDGMDGMSAARKGTREIALAVLATSLSLVVIFVPIAFMGGIVGRFFSSFGLTVAFAVMMSLFVSFTLTPMLCSRFLKLEPVAPGESHHAKSKSGFFYRIIDGGYGGVLRLALRYKFMVVVLTGMVIYSTVPIGRMMGMSLIPRDDQSEYEVSVTTPEGYSLERTSQITNELESRIWKLRGTEHVFTTIGQTEGGRVVKGEGDVTRSTIYVRITDLEKRATAVPLRGGWDVSGQLRRFFAHAPFDQFEIQQEARKFLEDYPDLRVSVNDVSPFQGGRRPQTFQVSLAGPDLNQLATYGDRLISELKREGGIVDLDTTLSLRKPEVQVAIDREAASDLGVPVGTIADTLRVLVGGLPVSKFREGDEQYDVWLRAESGKRSTSQDLYQITFPSPAVGLVKLASLAKLNEDRGPTEIERLSRERIVTVVGNPEGIAMGESITRAERILKAMNLPPQYTYAFTGQAKTLGETGYYFMVAFTLSITFMYLILAAQFESWMQPIAILMALPVTIPFGMLSLVMFHTPMDLYAMFGLFMLVGIVKKNGILQVDATNQLRANGLSRHDAIIEANHTRLRPILMTTVMLVAAMVPIALGNGPGAGARASMAKVIIGGQMLSLVLALLVTPVFYAMLDMFVNFTRRLGIRFSVEQTPRRATSPHLHAHMNGNGVAIETENEPAGSYV
jgi:hydrophobic/amphiphilic exporter-1 (mainly G- bacteria), HAE1 family